MTAKHTLRLEEYKDHELFYQLIVEPGLSREQIKALRDKPPYTPIAHRNIFEREMAIRSGWPFDDIVTETPERTVFGFPDALLDYTRQSTPEELARKLARTVGAVVIEE
jgi:hypothetical protein